MNTIDQRILIPASPTLIWEFLSDLSRLERWWAGCESVSFLSTTRGGPGTRIRLNGARGREQVQDIVAWYNGLGYEYIIVEGVQFKDNRGRIRLQELPEGTVVQWTFTFTPAGLMGGRGGRAVEQQMEESLKALYRQVTQLSRDKRFEAKSLMRDGPDLEARSSYRPRHPSNVRNEPGATATPAQAASTTAPADGGNDVRDGEFIFRPSPVAEPPRTAPSAALVSLPPPDEGDTRPNPAGARANDLSTSSNSAYNTEPDFLSRLDVSAGSGSRYDDLPLAPTLPQSQADPLFEQAFSRADVSSVASASPTANLPAVNDVLREPSPPTGEMPAIARERVENPPAPVITEGGALDLPTLESDALDESSKSIFEVFGLPRPSETQTLDAVPAPLEADAEPASSELSPVSPGEAAERDQAELLPEAEIEQVVQVDPIKQEQELPPVVLAEEIASAPADLLPEAEQSGTLAIAPMPESEIVLPAVPAPRYAPAEPVQSQRPLAPIVQAKAAGQARLLTPVYLRAGLKSRLRRNSVRLRQSDGTDETMQNLP